jgi:NAD+ synthase (glutamine-hydrolysing)
MRGATKSAAIIPAGLPAEKRNEYSLAFIKKWLDVFLWRFFKISQFKRSACAQRARRSAPAVRFRPRATGARPATAKPVVWLEELRNNVPEQ